MASRSYSCGASTWKKAALLAAMAATGSVAVGATGCAAGSSPGDSSQLGGSGSTISMADTLSYAMGAGLSCNNNLVIAGAIAAAESSLEPSNSSTNGPTKGCPSGSTDRGLWQINSCYHPSVTASCAFNPSCNASAMASISSNGTVWTPWATYNSGAYKSYMSQAMTAYSTVCGSDSGSGSDSGMSSMMDSGKDSGGSEAGSDSGGEGGSSEGGGDDGGSGDDGGGSGDDGGGSGDDGGSGSEDSASEDSSGSEDSGGGSEDSGGGSEDSGGGSEDAAPEHPHGHGAAERGRTWADVIPMSAVWLGLSRSGS